MERKGILIIPAPLKDGDLVFISKPGFSFIHQHTGVYRGSTKNDLIYVQVDDTLLKLQRKDVHKVVWTVIT